MISMEYKHIHKLLQIESYLISIGKLRDFYEKVI